MKPERRQQVSDVFDSAVRQPISGLEEFLRRACKNDEELYQEVRRMLQEHRPTASLEPRPFNAATDGPPVFQVGQIVAGRYRILRYLNRGGMGEVYEAQDLDLELAETIALKTLLPAIAGDEAMITRFKREIALSRKISHHNVCKVFDLARHESEDGHSVLFLTMEFLGGETLEARLRNGGAIREPEALPLVAQMTAALDAAHDAGVIHRDLKPSNVMLVPARDGVRVVVTDFGLAHRLVTPDSSTATISKAVAGTLDYMAPELLTGAAATFASDVYALGMVVYKMMTGSLPLSADAPMARAIKRSNRAVPSPRALTPGLDEDWEQAILRALDANPAKRFSRARGFLDALGGQTVASALHLPVITRRKLALAAAATCALAGAIGGWKLWVNAGGRLSPEAQALYQKGISDNAVGAWFAATKALEEAVKLAPHAAQVRARLAEAWVGLDMPEKAAEEMLLARRQDSSGLSKADRLQIEAIDLSITREFKAAAAKYEEMARLPADVDVDLGRAYENADRPEDAIRSYRRAAEGPEHNPAAWLRLGVLYSRRSNAAKSKEAFAQADRLYQLTSNLEGLTEVALQQGIAANTRGELDAAAAFLKKALDTARLAGNLQEEINATLRLSTNAYLSGATAEADRYAREALDTAHSHHLEAMAIRGLVNLGNAYRRKQDFTHSEQYYREALDLARQSQSAHLTALSLASLAALHDDMRQRDQSSREAQEALTFYSANGYAKESLQCLTLIARAKRDSGDYEGALVSFRGLLQMAEKSQDHAQLALAHEGIGTMLFNQDRFPDALDEYKKSLEFATDAEHIGYASLTCANTMWMLGQYQDATAMFARVAAAAEKFPPLRLRLLHGQAGMALSQNRFRDAADLARKGLSADMSRTPDLQDKLEMVLGLALMGAGNKREGAAKCEAARAGSEARHDILETLQARVEVLQARVELGDRQSTLQLLGEMLPALASHPELLWRTLALASTIDPAYSTRAKEALAQLSRLWGNSAYNTYLTRPDVGKLSNRL
jgi:tetratricopeptide (TPR) repeat protein